MANFYESKPMQWVKKAGEKVVGNKGIQAISSGMMMVMGVILLGAVFQLLAVILQTIGIIDQSSESIVHLWCRIRCLWDLFRCM